MKSSLLFVLVFTCCGLVASQTPEVAQEVQYCDLVRTPQQFAGKRIRVRAIYKYGFEMQKLQAPSCCPEARANIWVEIGELEGRSLSLYHNLFSFSLVPAAYFYFSAAREEIRKVSSPLQTKVRHPIPSYDCSVKRRSDALTSIMVEKIAKGPPPDAVIEERFLATLGITGLF